MNVTKAELANSLSEIAGLSKQDAKTLVDNFFAVISDALQQGEAVKISGFGNFSVRDKKDRPGCNPRTGEKHIISKRRVVTFKQGKKLQKKLILDEYIA